MAIALIILGVLFLALIRRDSGPLRPETIDYTTAARLIAAARLRRIEEEREERFRGYDRAWSRVSRPDLGRGYVVPFTSGSRRS